MKILNCCLVCYRGLLSPASPACTKNKECVTTARFIRMFQRHVNKFSLESTQIKVTSSALTFLPGNGSDNEPIKFQVCETCSQLLFAFNSSYGNLKCAEMKTNWSLHQLANVIRFADYAPTRKAKFRESVHDLEENKLLHDDMIEVIGKFRKQLQSQCRLRYKEQLPRVVLMKPCLGKIKKEIPESLMECEYPQNERIVPKEALLSAVLKNLSSLQLILYLALIDPSSFDKTDCFEADGLSEDEVNISIEDHFEVNSNGLEHSLNEYESDLESKQKPQNQAPIQEELRTKTSKCLRSVFKCDQCSQKFSSRAQRDSHSKKHHDYIESSPPPSTPLPISSSTDEGPMEEEHNTSDDVCLTVDDSDTNIVSNNVSNGSLAKPKVPKGSKSKRFRCVNCGKMFLTKKHLCTHYLGKKCDAKSTSKFVCKLPRCGKRFQTEKSRDIHENQCKSKHYTHQRKFVVKLKDEGATKDQADDNRASGDVPTTSIKEYRVHIIKNVTTNRCPPCELEFESVKELQRHLTKCPKTVWHVPASADSTNVPIKKEPVEISSQGQVELKPNTTKLKCTVEMYRCDQCGRGQRFENEAALVLHKKLIHSSHQLTKCSAYCCTVCGEKFSLEATMKEHMRNHTLEKRFKCPKDNCKATFYHGISLGRHLENCGKNSASGRILRWDSYGMRRGDINSCKWLADRS